MLERFRSAAIGLCLLVILGGLVAYFIVQSGGGEKLFGGGDGSLPPTDFTVLAEDGTTGAYLLCPQDLCQSSLANGPAPQFPVSAAILRQTIADYADNMPTIRTFRFDPVSSQFDFTERLPGESLPAVITVKVLPDSNYSSRLVIYSRKPLGENRDGEHQERVERWLRVIGDRLTKF